MGGLVIVPIVVLMDVLCRSRRGSVASLRDGGW